MRQLTGRCCLALLLAGVATQQANAHEAVSTRHHVHHHPASSRAVAYRRAHHSVIHHYRTHAVHHAHASRSHTYAALHHRNTHAHGRRVAYHAHSLPHAERLATYHVTPTHYNNIHQVNPSIVRAALLKQYAAWAGTRYRFGGTTHRGIDCSALMQHVFRTSFDYDLPRTTLGQVIQGSRVPKADLRPGDLVFFRPHRGDRHVGVYVGNGYFMHASTSQGVKLSRLSNPYWEEHYWTARRTMDNSELAARLEPSRVSDSI